MKNILIFTDSRGSYKEPNSNYKLYTEKLSENYNVSSYIYKYKWTTILDFLNLLNNGTIKPENYDYVILHVGISDFSPRHSQIAINNIYKDKKQIFDSVFGEENIKKYLNTDFNIDYEGDKTINLYSIEMAKMYIIPILQKINNLIWIGSNNIVDGWNGNYFRERPKNIKIIEEYSKIFCQNLSNVINLQTWSDDEIKKYTCDNMHLTENGSDFIYTKLINRIEKNVLIIMGNGPSLKNVDFGLLKKYDTFGLNGAYRKYKEINFYPTYFGCFDYVVCNHHSKSFNDLVTNSPIEKFFFLDNKYFSEDVKNNIKFQKLNFIVNTCDGTSSFDYFINTGCSGANATLCGLLMGYKKIILIGCDSNYINYIEESNKLSNGTLIINKTPQKNPNYWFDDYQLKGDIYNVPNPDIYHIPAWNIIDIESKKKNINIINCSNLSIIPFFKKSTLIKELC